MISRENLAFMGDWDPHDCAPPYMHDFGKPVRMGVHDGSTIHEIRPWRMHRDGPSGGQERAFRAAGERIFTLGAGPLPTSERTLLGERHLEALEGTFARRLSWNPENCPGGGEPPRGPWDPTGPVSAGSRTYDCGDGGNDPGGSGCCPDSDDPFQVTAHLLIAMRAPEVLIIGFQEDLHTRAVIDALVHRSVSVECVDFAQLTDQARLTFSLDGVAGAHVTTSEGWEIPFSEVENVRWRCARRPNDDEELDLVTRDFVRSEWEHFLEAAEAFAPRVRWVNPPAANRRAGRKGVQLVAAKAEGLRVPRTIITNDPRVVRRLAVEGTPLVYKRLGSTARPLTATRPLLPDDLERLDDLVHCPATFQERIDARLDIRVTAIGEDLYSAEIHSQAGAATLDWRLDHTVTFRPHNLDDQTAAQLRAMLRRLGLVYGAIDL